VTRSLAIPQTGPTLRAMHRLRTRPNLTETISMKARGQKKLHALAANRITLYIGEIATSDIGAVLDTLLGSCVAVCLYDPVLRIGGMNHILLPLCRAGEETPRCGVNAMELLINALMNLGGDRRRFIAKAFGGASVIQGTHLPPIGEKNSQFVRRFLANEKIPLVAERLGGDHAVHLYFHTDTGKAIVRTVDGSSLPILLRAERAFGKASDPARPFSGEITLF
jgi:chemotaxis receptor (MCP) glutamine deamidase CheD